VQQYLLAFEVIRLGCQLGWACDSTDMPGYGNHPKSQMFFDQALLLALDQSLTAPILSHNVLFLFWGRMKQKQNSIELVF